MTVVQRAGLVFLSLHWLLAVAHAQSVPAADPPA
jgi:hypothetical protein